VVLPKTNEQPSPLAELDLANNEECGSLNNSVWAVSRCLQMWPAKGPVLFGQLNTAPGRAPIAPESYLFNLIGSYAPRSYAYEFGRRHFQPLLYNHSAHVPECRGENACSALVTTCSRFSDYTVFLSCLVGVIDQIYSLTHLRVFVEIRSALGLEEEKLHPDLQKLSTGDMRIKSFCHLSSWGCAAQQLCIASSTTFLAGVHVLEFDFPRDLNRHDCINGLISHS